LLLCGRDLACSPFSSPANPARLQRHLQVNTCILLVGIHFGLMRRLIPETSLSKGTDG
jgi:hypothetical protein